MRARARGLAMAWSFSPWPGAETPRTRDTSTCEACETSTRMTGMLGPSCSGCLLRASAKRRRCSQAISLQKQFHSGFLQLHFGQLEFMRTVQVVAEITPHASTVRNSPALSQPLAGDNTVRGQALAKSLRQSQKACEEDQQHSLWSGGDDCVRLRC